MARHEYVCPLCMGEYQAKSISKRFLNMLVIEHDLNVHGILPVTDRRGQK